LGNDKKSERAFLTLTEMARVVDGKSGAARLRTGTPKAGPRAGLGPGVWL
jgi:hypothetical protein